MRLNITPDTVIHDLQQDFNHAFPYLKLEFYAVNKEHKPSRSQLLHHLTLSQIGLKKQGEMEITETMTVGELEKRFREEYDLQVQVSRQSGILWLETTMTDNWTLGQQNEHGKELSLPQKTILPDAEADVE